MAKADLTGTNQAESLSSLSGSRGSWILLIFSTSQVLRPKIFIASSRLQHQYAWLNRIHPIHIRSMVGINIWPDNSPQDTRFSARIAASSCPMAQACSVMVLRVIFGSPGAHCFRKRKEPDSLTTFFLQNGSLRKIPQHPLVSFSSLQSNSITSWSYIVTFLQGPTSLFVVGSEPSCTIPGTSIC